MKSRKAEYDVARPPSVAVRPERLVHGGRREPEVIKLLPLLVAAMFIVHPVKGPREVWRCSRFLVAAMKHRRLISSWISAGDKGGLAGSLAQRPEMIGIVQWPYVHKDWTVAERFQAIQTHYAELEHVPWLQVRVDEQRTILDLGYLLPGLRLVVDRTEWFQREGELTLNIFIDDTRVYTLAFLFGRAGDQRMAVIGAMQGRDLDNIQDTYRTLTKKLHGARPRDFLFTVFQMVAAEAGATRIRGVSDECRHHRHPYFGHVPESMNSANYNDIWADRQGVRYSDGFFDLPIAPLLREREDIPTRKRSMYKKRYEMYERIWADLRRYASQPDLALA